VKHKTPSTAENKKRPVKKQGTPKIILCHIAQPLRCRFKGYNLSRAQTAGGTPDGIFNY